MLWPKPLPGVDNNTKNSGLPKLLLWSDQNILSILIYYILIVHWVEVTWWWKYDHLTGKSKVVFLSLYITNNLNIRSIRGKREKKVWKISADADGGPRSQVCARLTLSSTPYRHQGKVSNGHVFKVTSKHLFQPLWSHIQCFRTIGQLFKMHSAEGPRNFVMIGNLKFLLLRSPCKVFKPYDNSFCEKSNLNGEREEERVKRC